MSDLGLDLKPAKPFANGPGNKLGPVVRTDMFRRAIQQKQLRQDVQNVLAVQLPLHVDRQARPRVLINDRQHAEHTSVVRAILAQVGQPIGLGLEFTHLGLGGAVRLRFGAGLVDDLASRRNV